MSTNDQPAPDQTSHGNAAESDASSPSQASTQRAQDAASFDEYLDAVDAAESGARRAELITRRRQEVLSALESNSTPDNTGNSSWPTQSYEKYMPGNESQNGTQPLNGHSMPSDSTAAPGSGPALAAHNPVTTHGHGHRPSILPQGLLDARARELGPLVDRPNLAGTQSPNTSQPINPNWGEGDPAATDRALPTDRLPVGTTGSPEPPGIPNNSPAEHPNEQAERFLRQLELEFNVLFSTVPHPNNGDTDAGRAEHPRNGTSDNTTRSAHPPNATDPSVDGGWTAPRTTNGHGSHSTQQGHGHDGSYNNSARSDDSSNGGSGPGVSGPPDSANN